MKIVTWNCNGAFRKKYDVIKQLNADIYIIQECENPTFVKEVEFRDWSSNHLWLGDNKNKGIGIFAKPGIDIKPLNWSNEYNSHFVKYFLPCIVNNEYQLLAIWAHQNNSPNFGYIGQVWKYLQINKVLFNDIIIAGDFNSNVQWDEWDRWWNHSDVVRELDEINIKSLYHYFFGEKQGYESKPTFNLHKKQNKPYHIDYCFASEALVNRLKNVEIGNFADWRSLSDHMPFIVALKEN